MATNKNNDTQALRMIEEINRREAEIEILEHPQYKTNRTFSYSENRLSESINLNTVTDIQTLLKIAAFIRQQEQSYLAIAKEFAVDNTVLTPRFTWQGFSAEDWIGDIKMGLNRTLLKSKKAALETFKTRLKAVMSDELKASLELEAMAKELGNF